MGICKILPQTFRSMWMQKDPKINISVAHGGGIDFTFACGIRKQ